MKAGVKTSELWVIVIAVLAPILQQVIPQDSPDAWQQMLQTFLASVVAIFYAWQRTKLKAAPTEAPK